MAKILIVEDEAALVDLMRDSLAAQGFLLDHVDDGNKAIAQLKYNQYDLIILDWSLPGSDGLTILKAYRDNGGQSPVLMLTGKRKLEDKETGLESGADDYLTKPFHVRELIARIKALLRRRVVSPAGSLTAGGIELDSPARRVFRDGKELLLLPKEFALLEFLMKHPSEVFSAEALIQRVWPTDSEVTPAAIRIYVTRLRKKIDKDESSSLITTVHGVGYRLDP
ncbi:MAG: response regulator transcription factor [Candidatus Melainabacteria bacterium]|nr:response regulator transcription factor [Candidatus Melainabacteria bacterium]